MIAFGLAVLAFAGWLVVGILAGGSVAFGYAFLKGRSEVAPVKKVKPEPSPELIQSRLEWDQKDAKHKKAYAVFIFLFWSLFPALAALCFIRNGSVIGGLISVVLTVLFLQFAINTSRKPVSNWIKKS